MDEMEKKPKKREWVKNAAIIFLAVMLVLTFFSNTILNRTLPEVVTSYVEPNSIDAKVRISGTVSARENYDVIIDQTRKVAAVNVKLGQEVSTGDVLFTLESGDSEELEQAKRELEEAQLSYQRFLVTLPDVSSDYSEANREIEQLRGDLEKAIRERDELTVPSQQALDAAAAAVERAKAAVDDLNELIRDGNLALKEAQIGLKNSSDGNTQKVPKELDDAISDAEKSKQDAKSALNAAMLAYGDDYAELKKLVLQAIERDKNDKYLNTLEPDEVDFLLEVFEERFYLKNAGYDEDARTASNGFDIVRRVLEEQGVSIAVLKKNDSSRKTDAACRDRENKLLRKYSDSLSMMPYYLKNVSDYQIDADANMLLAYQKIDSAKQDYSLATDAISAAQEARRAWLENNPSETAVKYKGKTHAYWEKEADRLQLQIDELSYRSDEAQTDLDRANETQDALKKQQDALKEANAEIETLQKSLEDKLFRLALQQKNDQKSEGKQQQINALDIQEHLRTIEQLQKKVDEYTGAEASEVKAKVNGTVATLSVSAGHKAEAGKTLATIEVKDLGYTMTATVSVDQAKLLHVGDTAKVSNYYWGSQTTAVLSGMQPDPKDPRTSRILTFDLAGDVNAGDSISFSIGERNASYDLVVPNSALRNDTNGSFVLMITAKNSPLGNRYFATRVDVEVIASDDYNTAVKGALSNMDSVITTSSGNAPVKNGDQVRLADTNNG